MEEDRPALAIDDEVDIDGETADDEKYFFSAEAGQAIKPTGSKCKSEDRQFENAAQDSQLSAERPDTNSGIFAGWENQDLFPTKAAPQFRGTRKLAGSQASSPVRRGDHTVTWQSEDEAEEATPGAGRRRRRCSSRTGDHSSSAERRRRRSSEGSLRSQRSRRSRSGDRTDIDEDGSETASAVSGIPFAGSADARRRYGKRKRREEEEEGEDDEDEDDDEYEEEDDDEDEVSRASKKIIAKVGWTEEASNRMNESDSDVISGSNEEDEDRQQSPLRVGNRDLSIITAEERELHKDFFRGHVRKTPERYLRVRNHILLMWEKCKPEYLTKRRARMDLIKECGDVNAIARIFEYLEGRCEINIGVEKKRPAPPMRKPTGSKAGPQNDRASKKDVNVAPKESREQRADTSDRKRAATSELKTDQNSNNPRRSTRRRETDMRAIEQGDVISKELVDEITMAARNAKYFGESLSDFYREELQKLPEGMRKRLMKKLEIVESSQHAMEDGAETRSVSADPYALIPPLSFGEVENLSPFELEVAPWCSALMTVHAFLITTEVIGLLGGKQESGCLKVRCAIPCKGNVSTGMQCELDPVSETEARHVTAAMNLDVVGWYHSHPRFAPNPSVRDIENQSNYQELFREEQTGQSPFVGAIVSPAETYPFSGLRTHAETTFFVVSHGDPYKLEPRSQGSVAEDECLMRHAQTALRELIGMCKVSENRACLSDGDDGQTVLSRMVQSVVSCWPSADHSNPESSDFVARLLHDLKCEWPENI